MSSTFSSKNISLTIFGESHGPGIGAVIDGLPAGEVIDFDRILEFMARRAPKKDGTSTFRSEKDFPEILSGIYNNKTTGEPICAVIKNTDQHSKDYDNINTLARPGHADYTGFIRYKGCSDPRGGGHFSGRLTAPLVFVGAICGQLLERRGIFSAAHILSIGDVRDTPFSDTDPDPQLMSEVKSRYLPVIDHKADRAMRDCIEAARTAGDSIGGSIECLIWGDTLGIGSPMFDGIENRISQLVFAIPAVKGIEFGAGFSVSGMKGSQNNDPFYMDGEIVRTRTNNSGGILGGIGDGMPIVFRAAFKPTPSISIPQNTVDYINGKDEIITIKGRHDPCIVPRAVPCVEAAANIAIFSLLDIGESYEL